MKPFALRKVLIFIILLYTLPSPAQIVKQWESRYTEIGYENEIAQDIITDSNGNIFVLGNSGQDALVTKYDPNGNLAWSFQAGRGVFLEPNQKSARNFKIDPIGNVYLLLRGHKQTESNPGVSLFKLDPYGKEVWRTHLTDSYDDGKVSLAVHEDGSSFVLKRDNFTNVSLTKINSAGGISWSKLFVTGVESFAQEVSIYNNSVVAWYYSGFQTYSRKSYLHVYNLSGDLMWENTYQSNTDGTHIRSLQYHSNELIVCYYINNSSNKASHRITRYLITDGSTINSFKVQMDDLFQSDKPVSVMYVGDDSHLYLMGESNYKVKKITLSGVQVWSYEYASIYPYRHEAIDFIVDKSTSSASVLVKTQNQVTLAIAYTIVNFKPDKTTTLLAKVTTTKDGSKPTVLAASETHLFVAGSFDNGVYKKDLQVAKFTKTDVREWETSFTPPNSEEHHPVCTATDYQGNIFVGGLLSMGVYDNAFGIIKYSPSGEQLWVKKIAPDNKFGVDLSRTKVLAMATTPGGDVVVTGGIQLGKQTTTIYEAPVELYTIKVSANGDEVWTAKTSSQTDDYLTGLQIGLDNNQNIYTLGSNYNLNNHNRDQLVLVKYDINGIPQWQKRFSFYSGYSGEGITSSDTDIPKMKIVNNTVYVASDGAGTFDNWNYFRLAELRKFDADGNETLLKQFTCDGCQSTQIRDLQIDSSGNIFLLHSDEFSKTTMSKITPTGQLIWSKDWIDPNDINFITNGSIAFDAADNVYLAMASINKLNYIKFNSNGIEQWNKKEELYGNHYNNGNPVYVFVTKDNAPVFLSTNQDAQGSKYFFMAECDKNTGEIKHRETFDENYDTYGWIPYLRPGDQLVSVLKPINSYDFFVTGVIQDKARNSETIVTLKYAIAPAVPTPQPFTASAISSSKIKLAFAMSQNNIQRIVYGSLDGIQFEQLIETQGQEFIHANLEADQTYYYKVVDTDGENFSVYSSIVETSTLKIPTIVSAAAIEVTNQQSFSIPLSSLQVENDVNYPTGYSLIILNGEHYDFSGDLITPKPDFAGTMTVGVQIASAEEISPVYNVTVKVNLPAPQPFTATAISSSKIKLSFTMTQANIERVVYWSVNGIQFEQLIETQGQEFIHANLEADQTYYYKIVDTDGENFSVYSSIVEASTLKIPTIVSAQAIEVTCQQSFSIPLSSLQVENAVNYPTGYSLTILNGEHYDFSGDLITPKPDFAGTMTVGVQIASDEEISPVFNIPVKVKLPAPQPFTATAISSSKIKLSFTVTQANIERLVYWSVNGIQFEQLDETQGQEFIHANLEADQTYYYKIVDTDGENFSVYSSIVEASTLKIPTIVSAAAIEVTNQQSFSIPLSSLQVENAANYPTGYSLIILNGEHYDFSGDLVTPKSNFVGTMTVGVQIASAEEISPVYNVTVKVNLPAPQPFTATAISSSKIKLSFTVTQANIERLVYWSVNGIQFEQLIETQGQEFIHANLEADQTYYYKIVDTDGENFSVYSSIVEASTLKIPTIVSAAAIEVTNQQSFSIPLSSLQVENAANYPTGYSLIILDGEHYDFSGDLITPKPNFVGNMTVSVQITSDEEMSPVYNVPVNVYLVTGIKESLGWSVYPNPLQDVLSISNDLYRGHAHVTIFDNLGKQVYSIVFTDASTSFAYDIDFKMQPSGSYIVVIEDGQKRKSRFRVIKF